MKRVVLAAVAVGLIGAGSPAKQPMSANERAYTLSVMCTVVAAHFHNESDHSRSLDAARKMARAMGYNGAKLSSDIISTASVLGNDLRSDAQAMDRNRAICRRIQLAS